MNKAIICGRLTKDPEVRHSDNNTAVAKYTVAVDRRTKDGGTDFIPCVAFTKNAEFAEKYLKKGIKVIVEGHIQTGSYTNKDGNKVYTTDLVVDSQEFAESKQSGEAAAKDDGFSSINGFPVEVEDDDVPFAPISR